MISRYRFAALSVFLLPVLSGCAALGLQSPSPTPMPPTNTPAPPTPQPSPTTPILTSFDELAGTWFWEVGGVELVIVITSSGSMRHTGTTFEAWFEDGLLHVRERSEAYGGCPYDQIGIYQVQGIPGEYLLFEPVDDPCPSGLRLLAAEWINSDAR